jgi:serine/threonine protein kinase
MRNESLEGYLFHEHNTLRFGKFQEIAYLHDNCKQRIIPCDIKLGIVLLESKFNSKVADFGLANLVTGKILI